MISLGSLDSDLPKLSVVVIGRNEGDRLRLCILSAQSIRGWQPHEILYVDSGSTDGSSELAAALGARVLPLPPGAFTAARARNVGWKFASGTVILFLDGDTILKPDFPLVALAKLNEDKSSAAVWGHRREINPCISVYVRILDLDWVYAPGETLFFGGDVLIRREALQEVGGFDETLIAGEEPEMCRRMRQLQWRIQHIDEAMTMHDLAITRFSQYWRRSKRAGFAFAAVSNRFLHTSDPFWAEESSRNRQRGLFWLVSPILLAILSLTLLSPWPILIWLLLLVALSSRTAWHYRWKPASWQTLLIYGIHSHLQQIPILFGQIEFRQNRNKALMEYKDIVPVEKEIGSAKR